MDEQNKQWVPYKNGTTIGQKGTENGVIIADEEYDRSSHITLESDGYQHFGVTCGIYGAFFHTAFASTEEEAWEKYECMKNDIKTYLDHLDQLPDDEYDEDSDDWVETFCDKW